MQSLKTSSFSSFQSTPPCAGGDAEPVLVHRQFGIFQSTPPCAGGDVQEFNATYEIVSISIHAPLCGGRLRITHADTPEGGEFQSTPPCAGGDLWPGFVSAQIAYFNPRPPVRGATAAGPARCVLADYFNPRPPVRGATAGTLLTNGTYAFQSTPPCAGGDALRIFTQTERRISIHAPLCGGRHKMFTIAPL